MGSQEEFHRRKRRRKTKSERDKTRTSVPSQGDVDVKQDVSRHLKMARNISYPLRSMGGIVGEKASIITQSRLTRRLGLYNQSKTSRKICRDTIIMPETVRKKTEEDLRKILDLTEKMPALQMEVDIDEPGPGLPAMNKHQRETKCSAISSHCVPSSGISLPCTSVEVTPVGPSASIIKNQHSVNSIVSACTSSDEMEEDEDEMPSSPPMAEIAEYLCSELKNQTVFKERDLVQEICDDLIKNFRSIGPQCATPSSKQNENSIAAGSIRRTLLNSYINSPNKENTDLLVPTAEVVISKKLLTSESRSSDHMLPYIHKSKSENIKNVFCKSIESCKHNILDNIGTMHSNENDQRQECANALILLGQTNQEVQQNEEKGTSNGTYESAREINRNLEIDDINVLTFNHDDRKSDVHSMKVTEIRSSPDAISLLVQNDQNETSVLSKPVECRSSHINKDAFRSYRNYKIIENHLKHREASLNLAEINPHCYQHQKKSHLNSVDISQLYKSNCSQHSKEYTIPRSYSQTSGFQNHYSQMSNVSNTVSSLDQLFNSDRPLERYPCSGEHTFVAPRSHQKMHRPLESHRQNLALAIQSAALPWTKDISFENRKKTAVVTEFQHPEFMPRFHGDFYKDALLFEDDVWPEDKRSILSTNEASENMDILEYLDHGEESNSGQVHHNLHRHGNKIYSRKLLRPGSPDSDGSPTWIASDTSLRSWKPNLDSPGSPQKLYPRRLY